MAEGVFRAYAVKDEYEVARLHASAVYGADPVFHLAPPLVSGVDKATGRRRKVAISGRVALPLFRALRHGKVLRGTPLDVFGWQAERRLERAFTRQYERALRQALPLLRAETMAAGVALARLPMDVRGFGPVKEAGLLEARPRLVGLMLDIRGSLQGAALHPPGARAPGPAGQ